MGTEGSGASRAGAGFHNEDAFLVEEGLGLYVVCDGFSDRPGGEVAAALAVEALEAYVEQAERRHGEGAEQEIASPEFAASAICFAMRCIVEASRAEPELEGMATTVSMLLAQGRRGVIGHTGDSRVYLVRAGRLHLLTVDHEWADSLDASRGAVAAMVSADQPVDVFSVDLQPEDTFLLCTDGAEEVVQDPALVRAAGELSPRLLASRIASAAEERKPGSDATAVVVRVLGDSEPAWLDLSAPRESYFRPFREARRS